MRYMDPESIKNRKMPTNFDSRQPFTRPNGGYQNRQRPPHNPAGAGEGKWQRGHEARPDFQKQRQNLDDELDNYGTKAQKAGTNGGEEFDDWRKGRADQARDGGRDEDKGRSLGDRIGGRRERSASPRRRRSVSPRRDEPEMRPSPPRGGDRRSEESDMVLDDD